MGACNYDNTYSKRRTSVLMKYQSISIYLIVLSSFFVRKDLKEKTIDSKAMLTAGISCLSLENFAIFSMMFFITNLLLWFS